MSRTAKADTIRAFVALDLDTMSVRRIARVAEHLRMASGAPSATWTPAAKIHVTLKFIGELSGDAVAPLGAALSVLASTMLAPHSGQLRLDAFPSVSAASVVVIELEDPTGDIGRLAEKADRAAAHLGVAREESPFRPHVTLARLKRPYDARRWMRPDLASGAGDCTLSRLTLYRSTLGSEGSSYDPLARFDFASA